MAIVIVNPRTGKPGGFVSEIVGYNSVMKMSGKRRKPYMVRVTTGWTIDPEKGTKKQTYNVIGYAETKQEGLQMLSDYHQNPFSQNDIHRRI